MYEVLIYCYVISVGFALAGFLASCSKLMTGQAISFMPKKEMLGFWVVPAILLRLFAGPYILVRNSIRGAILEKRAAHWLAFSFMLATFWSFISGAVMIEAVIRIFYS